MDHQLKDWHLNNNINTNKPASSGSVDTIVDTIIDPITNKNAQIFTDTDNIKNISSGILKLTPHMQETLWGGDFFAQLYNLSPGSKIGETWELYSLTSMNLESSYLIKYLDANLNLSVQVHPDDFWSRRHGQKYGQKYGQKNNTGKSECWIILNAEKGSGLYLGLKDHITFEEFEMACRNEEEEKEEKKEKSSNLHQFLNFIPVKQNDFLMIPAGLIHAIGEGVRLLEIQQNSNITYRIWDWNRLDKNGMKRELHLNQALEVISSSMHLNYLDGILKYQDIFNTPSTFSTTQTKQAKLLIEHADFSVYTLKLNKGESYQLSLESPLRPATLLCLQGEINIFRGRDEIKISSYETAFLPHNSTNNILHSLIEIVCESNTAADIVIVL
ncbi:MAG: class I mannose-6-phosphate isomerase [Oligoflexia bacterium]|nr:class I mannose-6-phosphate isomerase [Oligoflexia bacterium]